MSLTMIHCSSVPPVTLPRPDLQLQHQVSSEQPTDCVCLTGPTDDCDVSTLQSLSLLVGLQTAGEWLQSLAPLDGVGLLLVVVLHHNTDSCHG